MPSYSRILSVVSFVACTACSDVVSSNSSDPETDSITQNASDSAVAYSIAPLPESIAEVGANAVPVVGGKESALCGWPSTLDIDGCTGTLIHPRVVATAAHCISRSTARITFTAGTGKPGSFTVMGNCTLGARNGAGGVGPRDWAYCVLPDDERVKKIPFTPPLVGCEAERYLKAGNKAWVVGFGATGGRANDYGVKREVEVKINKVENGIIDIGEKGTGACYGDSGGPLYIQITDGTHDWGWRIAGSTSGAGGSCDCTCSTIYTDIRSHIKALEMNEDFDVTPCTDDAGNWAPGPDCNNLITNPATGMGTYPNCTVPRTTEPIASCGAPAGSAGAAGAGAAGGGAAGASAAGATGGAAGGAAAGSGAITAAAGGQAPAGAAGTAAGAAGTAGMSVTTGAAGIGAMTTAGTVGTTLSTTPPGATAGWPALGSAGMVGQNASAATVAGAVSIAMDAPASTEAERGGCQIVRVGTGRAGTFGLVTIMLIAGSASVRSRKRRARWARSIRYLTSLL